MARTQLTATTLAADNATSDLNVLLTTAGNSKAVVPATGAGNGVQFANFPTQTLIGFALLNTACTVTVNAGMAGVGGLSATTYTIALPVGTATVPEISFIGGFHSIMNQAGTIPGIVTLDFSSNTGLVVALFAMPVVY